jgi:NAD-dependent deacetylase
MPPTTASHPPADARDDVARARALLAAARRVVIFTGAGVSAESGVPTFRGAGGLWRSFRPEELATPAAFARDPRLVWEWYAWRRDLVRGCAPNAAHRAIAAFAAARPGTAVVTQNVDGLHQRAAAELAAEPAAGGTAGAAAPVLALHGSLFATRCARCDYRAPDDLAVDATSADALPRCPRCGAPLRPDVVWFGESLDAGVLGAAFDAAGSCDACLVVGTSAVVHPAAGVATAAARSGAALVEVNAEDTPLSPRAAVALRGRAAELVPALLGA